MNPLERRLAWLVLQPAPFTADDLTDNGRVAIDPDHSPNGKQSGIGSLIQWAARERLISWTGHVVKSQAPKRKGGMIRVWAGTAAGKRWARELLAEITEDVDTGGRL